MTDETPVLTPEDIREEARQILIAIDASRDHRAAFEDNWRRLWQLLREAKAAYLPAFAEGPWSLSGDGGEQSYGASRILTAGNFELPVWPPEEARSRTDLPELLNWAAVPVPNGR